MPVVVTDTANEPDKTAEPTGTPTTQTPEPLALDAIGLEGLERLDNTLSGFGYGPHGDGDNRPTDCETFQEKYAEYDTIFIAPPGDNIFLTFDEGYEAGYTEQILDTLKEKDCRAVFFCTLDYFEQNAQLVRRMIDEGHIVGNHSATHKSMPSLGTLEMANEIINVHNYVLENFGYEMTYFRAPMGEYSERTLALAHELGYTSMFWSFAYVDWDTDNQPELDDAFERITSRAHGGAIYLLHAVSETNAEILGDVIDYIRENGYTLALYGEGVYD
jgi:peptidoglycan-N-acetylmuramic acid deacetylase